MAELQYSEYASVAHEYYDEHRHPTCANFRDLSAVYVGTEIGRLLPDGKIVEVGCGKALVPALLVEAQRKNVVLVDSSQEMMRHSAVWEQSGVKLHIGDARGVDAVISEASLLVASLADPYNDASFWRAAYRCLAVGGSVIATLPSFEWASLFRVLSKAPPDAAEFQLSDGTTHLMKSLVPPLNEQVALIQNSGLTIRRFEGYGVEQLSAGIPLSPKLRVSGHAPVVWGFTAQKIGALDQI